VAGGQAAHAYHVHVVLGSLAGDFGRCLEQGP
jgi:hypothetical protein